MADMLIDDAKFAACLDAEADAIRAKTGDSNGIPFDYANNKGFADAIAAIPSGGENQLVALMNGSPQFDINDDEITKIDFPKTNIRSIHTPNATVIAAQVFRLLQSGVLTTVFAPNAVAGTEAFMGCITVKTIVCKGPKKGSAGTRPFRAYVANTMQLETVDLTASDLSFQGDTPGIGADCFEGDYKFNLLILRSTELWPLSNISAFGRTPFASGGSGGTIYIPKTLYDHLGDGTSLDYKAATNWSTLDSYGTITWAQIEGSIYETQYADGTPIPSE